MTSKIEQEFVQFDNDENRWPVVYQEVKNEAAQYAIDEDLSTLEAKKPANRNKNRYRDVSPYDHSRIILHKGETDYINANLVVVPEANRRYILAQGPLEHTAGHFWQMVWEQKSVAVIMLNKFMENGYRKCHQYFPLGEERHDEDDCEFEDVGLKLTLLEEKMLNYYIVRKFELENVESGETREVMHYNYVTWPDFGVPQSPHAFLNFLMAIRENGCLEESVGPAIVHCSAGVGRSGTFCLVDSCLVTIEKTGDMNAIDIRSLLLKMRTYRMGLIQTAAQLRFSYAAVIEGGHRILNNEDSTLSVLSSYMQEDTKKSREDKPPAPPPRTTSLSPSHLPREQPPPLPQRVGLPKSLDNFDRFDGTFDGSESDDLIDDDDEDDDDDDILMNDSDIDGDDEADIVDINTKIKDEREQQNNTGDYELRRRKREERLKNTKEQIDRMRKKQKDSELWKKRRSFLKPIAIGLTLLIGGLIIYKLYW